MSKKIKAVLLISGHQLVLLEDELTAHWTMDTENDEARERSIKKLKTYMASRKDELQFPADSYVTFPWLAAVVPPNIEHPIEVLLRKYQTNIVSNFQIYDCDKDGSALVGYVSSYETSPGQMRSMKRVAFVRCGKQIVWDSIAE